jgi:hypothetical protein
MPLALHHSPVYSGVISREKEREMSGYASKAEVLEVIRSTIEQDGAGTGLSRDPGAYSLAGIVRDVFHYRGAGYGWGVSAPSAAEWAAAQRRHLRRSRR